MEKWLNENDSAKRVIMTAVTGLVTMLGGKYGVSENIIMTFIGFMGSVIFGSNIHAAAKAKGEAAAEAVDSPVKAAEVLGGKVVP